MAIVRWDRGSDMARLRARVRTGSFGEREGEWMPAADITRDADSITMKVDLPGLTADDVTVELRDSHLVITGERTQETEEKHEGMVSRERVFGTFMRSVALPAGVTADDIKASFANGELTVEVSLPAEVEGKQIEVHTPRRRPSRLVGASKAMNRALGADNAPLPRPVDSGGSCRRPDDSRSPSPSRPRGDAGECLIPARLVAHL